MKLKTEISLFIKLYEKSYITNSLFPYCKAPKSLISNYYKIRKETRKIEKLKNVKLPFGFWLLRKYALELTWIFTSISLVISTILLFSLFKGIVIILISTSMIFLWLLKLQTHKVYREVYRKLIEIKNLLKTP